MKKIIIGTIGILFSVSSMADIVKSGDKLYVVNPSDGHASEIINNGSARMTVVAANTVRVGDGSTGALFSVDPATGALNRIDVDRKAPEAGMVSVIR